MCYKLVILGCSLLIVLLAIAVSGTSVYAGSISQGPAANRQFSVQGKAALDGLWGLSDAPAGQHERRLTFPLASVDPGSGQLIWQMVAAACVGGLFYIKRVRDFLGRLVKKWFKKR
jgi:hypothetical protein